MSPTWFPRVRVRYTDGTWVEGDASAWAEWRADGVDAVWIGNPKETHFSGDSLYWLYWEQRDGAPEGYWVGGCGTVANVYTELPAEVMFHRSGEQWSRPIKFMPDLPIDRVKLGWWTKPVPEVEAKSGD